MRFYMTRFVKAAELGPCECSSDPALPAWLRKLV